jgi:hypothetical protein
MLERGVGGKYSLLWRVELRPRADGAYDIITEKDPFPVSFHDIGNGRFVGQAKADTPPTYGYGVMMRQGAVVFLYTAGCDWQDFDVLESHGVDRKTCSIDGVKNPVKLFNAISADEPTFKLVPIQ